MVCGERKMGLSWLGAALFFLLAAKKSMWQRQPTDLWQAALAEYGRIESVIKTNGNPESMLRAWIVKQIQGIIRLVEVRSRAVRCGSSVIMDQRHCERSEAIPRLLHRVSQSTTESTESLLLEA